ncbi:MAG: uracil-DNA glycosylase [Gammaproteobacteria bacterium]|nr:uracil-DNA glycosylase [Gammaproteobacteria bacterium]NIR98143.1 uracil-DNA glycosylase [Gammaproteobacteria bacterium]NIT62530.1 uracil-DNA glycosylase [Gammaproteobacteria bacterium]NIV20787.1 uracil-DNA glycosylase [Gammaproteobacteria bacterium]NIY31110.1 uracil-DNA glycosylase [Gammaproteobacteria bacterium]
MPASVQALRRHLARVRKCTLCPDMTGPPVTGDAAVSPVMLIGQAPGPHEIEAGRPFTWTAGKTLFGWFEAIGLDEPAFRRCVYIAAVCRCFPGKNPKGGDRVPDQQEIENCSRWRNAELELLKPRLVIPAGKLAVAQLMQVGRLDEVVGRGHRVTVRGLHTDVVPLPHPSGASTWHRTEPGKTLLKQALRRIQRHPAWQQVCARAAGEEK